MDLQTAIQENESLRLKLKHEKEENAELRRLIFAAKRERFISKNTSTDEATLFDVEKAVVPIVKPRKSTKPKPKSPRCKLPSGLKRVTHTINPEGLETKTLVCIGEDNTEILAIKPASLYVIKYVRPKYVDLKDESKGVVQAPIPARIVERGMVDESLLADLMVEKIQFHTPVYRYSKKLKQVGINWIRDSQLRKWFAKGAEALMPMNHLLINDLLSQPYIQVDETTMPVLSKLKPGSTHRGYMWAICSPQTKGYAFYYDPSRSAQAACQATENYKGIIQVDGYGAYEVLGKRTGATLAHCMAHARRKFFEAFNGHPPNDHLFLSHCQKLYAIESEARKRQLTTDQRLELRQKLAIPILKEMKIWLDKQIENGILLPKNKLAKAIGYSLKRWNGLSLYATDGRIEIDNNLVENSIRPIALGRKNYLFAGSHEAAQNLACLYSLIGTCNLNKLNTKAYIEWLLKMVASNKINDNAIKWLPHRLEDNLRNRFILK